MAVSATIMNINESPHPGYGRRHVLCALLFFAYVSTIFCRGNMSIAVLSMTSNDSSNPNFPIYDWGTKEKNSILSSYFWGLVIGSTLAGEVFRLLGPRSVLYISFLGQTILSAITELCALTGGWVFLSVNRCLIGVCSGFVDPLFFYLSSKWLPISERDTLINIIYCGGAIGTGAASLLCGVMAAGPTGWPSIFYLSAVLTFTFCVLWKCFGYWSPRECKSIRDEELIYIEKSLATSQMQKAVNIPWKEILTSMPVCALIVTGIAQGGIQAILDTQMSLYLDSVYNVSVTLNGLLTSISVYLHFILQVIIGKISDVLIEKKILVIGQIRKLATIIAIPATAVMIVLIGLIGDSLVTTIVLLFLAYFCSSFSYAGFMTNALDLSFNFSQSIVGLCRAVEYASSAVAPLIISALLTDENSQSSWAAAFTEVSVPCLILNLFYIICGKAERQSWDMIENLEEATQQP